MKHEPAATAPGAGTTVTCPVCRMDLDPADAPASLEHGGETYSFCNLRCRDRFRERPEAYVARGGGKTAGRVAAG